MVIILPNSKTIKPDSDFVLKQQGSNSQGTGNDKVKVQESNSNLTTTQAQQQDKSTLTSSAGTTVNNCGGSSPIGGMQVGVKNLMHDVKTINARLEREQNLLEMQLRKEYHPQPKTLQVKQVI